MEWGILEKMSLEIQPAALSGVVHSHTAEALGASAHMFIFDFIWNRWNLHAFQSVGGKDVILPAETMARISATAPDFSLASDIIQESILHIVEGISC